MVSMTHLRLNKLFYLKSFVHSPSPQRPSGRCWRMLSDLGWAQAPSSLPPSPSVCTEVIHIASTVCECTSGVPVAKLCGEYIKNTQYLLTQSRGGLRNGIAEEGCTAKAEIHEATAGYLSCSHERREVSGLQGNKQNNNLSFLLLPPLLHWFPVTFQVCLVPPNTAEGVCLHRLLHHLGHSTVVLDTSVSGLII